MDATRPTPELEVEAVAVVVDPDATRAGAAVRARLDAGERVAGFVGDPDDPAVDRLITDVIRPPTRSCVTADPKTRPS